MNELYEFKFIFGIIYYVKNFYTNFSILSKVFFFVSVIKILSLLLFITVYQPGEKISHLFVTVLHVSMSKLDVEYNF